MPLLKVWVCRAWSRTSNGSIDVRGIFLLLDKDLELINLTVSLITAEIIGLCQRVRLFQQLRAGPVGSGDAK